MLLRTAVFTLLRLLMPLSHFPLPHRHAVDQPEDLLRRHDLRLPEFFRAVFADQEHDQSIAGANIVPMVELVAKGFWQAASIRVLSAVGVDLVDFQIAVRDFGLLRRQKIELTLQRFVFFARRKQQQ